MRFRRTSSFNYIEFIRRERCPTDCECGDIPANHVHKAYKWFEMLPYKKQLEILEKEYSG
jgi:hypothetical protein